MKYFSNLQIGNPMFCISELFWELLMHATYVLQMNTGVANITLTFPDGSTDSSLQFTFHDNFTYRVESISQNTASVLGEMQTRSLLH